MAQSSNSGSDSPKTVTIRMDPAEFLKLLPCADLVMFEHCQLDDKLAEKDRQLSEAQAEIRALRSTIQQVEEDISNLETKHKMQSHIIERTNYDIEDVVAETNAAVGCFLKDARARLTCKTAIKEIKGQLKFVGNEIAMLQLNSDRSQSLASKNSCLLDDLRNQQQKLMKEIHICKMETVELRKMHHQKVYEVEALTQNVH